jgi:hypothetical protein
VVAKSAIGVVLAGLVIARFFAAEARFGLLWTFWSEPLAGLVLFKERAQAA